MVNGKFNKFSVKEVANLLNISVQAVHFYEKKGLIHPRRNPENNYREYTLTDIVKLYYSIKYNRIGLKLSEFPEVNNTNKTSVEDLKDLIQKKREQIKMDNAICQYVEDSLQEEEMYLKNGTDYIVSFQNLTVYTLGFEKYIKNDFSDNLKNLIPISSIMSSGVICNGSIDFYGPYFVIREKYYNMINTDMDIPLNSFDKINVSKGLQLITAINPGTNNKELIFSKYYELKKKYPSIQNTFYIIPLLSVQQIDDSSLMIIKIIAEL